MNARTKSTVPPARLPRPATRSTRPAAPDPAVPASAGPTSEPADPTAPDPKAPLAHLPAPSWPEDRPLVGEQPPEGSACAPLTSESPLMEGLPLTSEPNLPATIVAGY
ncbi:hypothetical protein [Streptomyces sp. NPDC001568]|uniref:hypothetical protein n=1 Tax=Streptomyces sp. NPDC001568 TaxID=3364588 RepID=UPI00367A5E86